jgi:hypothetical protein
VKLGASFTLPFADCHSSYSENVRMSTVGREIRSQQGRQAFPDKPPLHHQSASLECFSSRYFGRAVATPEI